MRRFFIQQENLSDDSAVICGEDVKHISLVLRLREGDLLTLCDCDNMEYTARIQKLEPEKITLGIEDRKPCDAELSYKVTLLQGLPKAGKMEIVIQKCVELGASEFIPVMAARSVVKITPKDFEKKRQRYQKVAQEAAKQARRGTVPEVGELKSFFDIDFSSFDLILLFYEEEQERDLKTTLRSLNAKPRNIAIVIGPEGGLERKEAEHIENCGGIPLTLGKRILRTETAGMAALAMLQYELGG